MLQIVARQTKGHRRLKETSLRAAIETLTAEAQAKDVAAFLDLVIGGVASNAAWGMAMTQAAIDRHTTYSVRLFLRGLLPQGDGAMADENRRLKALLAEAAELLGRASR